jgi:hypothetical protein
MPRQLPPPPPWLLLLLLLLCNHTALTTPTEHL